MSDGFIPPRYVGMGGDPGRFIVPTPELERLARESPRANAPLIVESRPVLPGDWIVGFGPTVGLCIGVAIDYSLYSFHLFERGRLYARKDVERSLAEGAGWRRASSEEIASVRGG